MDQPDRPGRAPPFETLQRRRVLDAGRFLAVELHRVRLPDGRTIDDWGWVITPDFANVIAVTPDGRLPFFRQAKYAIEGLSLAPVGGYLEPGEDPRAGAARELAEEIGYVADDWRPVGGFVVDSNRGAGRAHFFLALGARPGPRPPVRDDLEAQELLFLSRAETAAALDRGEFRCLAWASAVALGLRALEAANPARHG